MSGQSRWRTSPIYRMSSFRITFPTGAGSGEANIAAPCSGRSLLVYSLPRTRVLAESLAEYKSKQDRI
jgi:hypothetical protein